jgi:NADH-quinone oxidoreductase subunit I
MATATFPKKRSASTKPVAVTYAPRSLEVRSYLPEVARGVAVSMKHFFENTRDMIRGQRPDPVLDRFDDGITTISYPEEQRPYPARFRGMHRLTTRADGSMRCVACLCCSTACPAQCIHIETGEYPEGGSRRGYERYPVKFVIDELRCIFCGYCVEACPCDAIRMDTGMHAVPYDSRDQFIYDRDLLLSIKGRDGTFETQNPRHEPGDPTHPGLTRAGH